MSISRAEPWNRAADDDDAMSLRQIAHAMDGLVRAKGWYGVGTKRPQTPRNLATSLAIEASELLECFQWDDDADVKLVADEIADVVLYAVQLANVLGISLDAAVRAKLERNHGRTWDAGSSASPVEG